MTWRNTTQRTVTTLPFHLYMNGFRAEDTAWMRSSRGRHRRRSQQREGAWGYIEVHSVELERPGSFVTAEDVEGPPGETVALEWSEDPDPSTMTAALPRPVGPGESVTVRFEFTTQLPRVIARTGYYEDFHAVGQWYPKIGVLEDEAGWQAHAFTVNDEFYADFGDYQAVLDVPAEMIVGATGIRTAEEIADGRKRLTYRAEMVHDFAWMADPDFVERDGEYRGIRIRQLIQPEHVADAEAHLATQLAALESYEARYGPYPWSTITIVHAPAGAEDAGGMEYPTLYTTLDRAPIPRWLRATLIDERSSGLGTTVHEFGHQYFQGLFASREHLEPWLDEGMDTASNYLSAMDHLGDDAWVARVLTQKIFLRDLIPADFRRRGDLEPIDRPASAFKKLVGNYGETVYGKVGALILTLRNLAGPEAFDRALRDYCEQARFRHPRGKDLEAALVAGLGERVNVAAEGAPPVELDLRHYLDQALRTTKQVDFSILRVVNRPRPGHAGWQRGDDGELTGGEPPAYLDQELDELADDEIEGAVVVRRRGDFVLPVDLSVEFADGTSEQITWDGRADVEIFTWPGRRARLATLDPEHKLLLETRRLDNTAAARDLDRDDGLSRPFGDLAEAMSLAVLGSLGL